MPRVAKVPEPLVDPLRDTDCLVRMLAGATGQRPHTVRERLARENRRLGSNVREAMREWGLEPHCWNERLAQFYAETDAFLYETVTWNRTPAKCAMRRWIAGWLARVGSIPRRLLVYGDGPGIDSFYFAAAGHRVDYHEPSAACARFAEMLFEGAQPRPAVLPGDSGLGEESYETIVCLDVLEHVPDPPALVMELARALKPGGELIVHAPFFSLTGACPTHLRSNLRFCGEIARLYRPARLHPVGGRLCWDPVVLRKIAERSRAPARFRSPRIATGQALLGAAKIWSGPHLLAARYAAFAGQRSLSRLAAGYGVE